MNWLVEVSVSTQGIFMATVFRTVMGLAAVAALATVAQAQTARSSVVSAPAVVQAPGTQQPDVLLNLVTPTPRPKLVQPPNQCIRNQTAGVSRC